MRHWKVVLTGIFVFCLVLLCRFCMFTQKKRWKRRQKNPFRSLTIIRSNPMRFPGGRKAPRLRLRPPWYWIWIPEPFCTSKNATSKQYPASITKIMTTLLLVENCNLEDTITFSEIVYDLEEGSSHLGIQPGEKMTLKDAAYGMMLASANDICNGVAEYMDGSISAFADRMNRRAEELGCVNTHFSNPHGLYSEDHYTCAYDMALIARAAYENPVFREITGTSEYTIPKTNVTDEERSFLNHHKMLQKEEAFYQDWCTGGKNGYTEDCLNTLVTYAEKDGRRLVSVVLRVNGADKSYSESTQILNYAFDSFSDRKMEAGAPQKTFYEIMGLDTLGKAEVFQSPVWKRTAATGVSMAVTLPGSANLADLEKVVSSQDGEATTVAYQYGDTAVGTAAGRFAGIYAPVQMVFEGEAQPLEASSGTVSQEAGEIQNAAAQAVNLLTSSYDSFVAYADENLITVAAAGLALLVILIVFVIVLIFRCTKDSRMKRRRRQEEAERRRREEEIDRMTTAEIEAELRAVMEEERKRKEQEMLANAEAERAAREAREMEEKLHETEALLDELEAERQERLKKEKGINS